MQHNLYKIDYKIVCNCGLVFNDLDDAKTHTNKYVGYADKNEYEAIKNNIKKQGETNGQITK